MSMNRPRITDWFLNLNPMESMEEANDPGFEEFGLLTVQLQTHRQFAEISLDEIVIEDHDSIFTSKSLPIRLSFLCSDDQQVIDYLVGSVLDSIGLHHLLIDQAKTQIVSEVVQMAIDTKNRGLKQFGLMVDIGVTTLTEVVPEIDEEEEEEEEELDLMENEEDLELMEEEEEEEDLDLMQEELRWVLMQSMAMGEMNLKRNPASKSSIEKLKRGFFEGGVGNDDELDMKKNCAVCLDEFEIGSEVIWMPCSHMFHGEGCLLPWLEESNSCPLCRLELTD